MNIDVAKAIKELLYEKESVILPGLGGFVATPVASEVDYVQGAVQPPTKKIEFNTNLVTNDGVLVHYIQKKDTVTAQEAQIAIENYVDAMKRALDQKEIVDIPSLGRLYRDYEQKVRFMPDDTNFESASFGLPNVKFHPVARPKKTPAAATHTPSKKAPPPPPPPIHIAEKSWVEQALPWLIVAAAILLAISLFLGLRGCGDEGPLAVVPQERVNVKPDENLIMEEDEPADLPPETTVPAEPDPPVETTSPDEKTAPTYDTGETDEAAEEIIAEAIFLVVHSFGNHNNAKNFANQLKRGGYLAVSKKYNGLWRVGIEVPAAQQHELEGLVKELGRKFKAKPVVAEF